MLVSQHPHCLTHPTTNQRLRHVRLIFKFPSQAHDPSRSFHGLDPSIRLGRPQGHTQTYPDPEGDIREFPDSPRRLWSNQGMVHQSQRGMVGIRLVNDPSSSQCRMLLRRRKVETRINEQPNYTAKVNVDGNEHTVHFMGLFSEREDAVPIIFCNGWPSCFLEFLPLIELVRKQYSAKDLPYVPAPKQPG